jgi:hypothetical protein
MWHCMRRPIGLLMCTNVLGLTLASPSEVSAPHLRRVDMPRGLREKIALRIGSREIRRRLSET